MDIKKLEHKKNQVQAKVTSYLTGKAKKAFFDDCIDQEEKEAIVLREIVYEHYKRKGKY